MPTLADWFRQHTEDYGQLKDAYPNAKKFGSALKSNVSKLVPTEADFQSPQKMGEWSMSAAMNAPMGLMFTGPKSAGWNASKAAEAEKMLNAGIDPAQVWKEHLIGRMPDKSLFSEIDDSGSSFLPKETLDNLAKKDPYRVYNAPINQAMTHQELFNQYPELNKTSAYYDLESPDYAGASFDPSMNEIILGAGLDNNQLKSGSLHELQHAIQDQEGWGKGGSPEMFNQQSEAQKARDALMWAQELKAIKKKSPYLDLMSLENKAVKNYEEMGLFDMLPSREARDLGSQPRIVFNEKYPESTDFKDLSDLVSTYGLKHRVTPYSPMEAYKRLTGEAQARATQDRMGMNMQQRRDTYPLAGDKLSDIPLSQLINRYR